MRFIHLLALSIKLPLGLPSGPLADACMGSYRNSIIFLMNLRLITNEIHRGKVTVGAIELSGFECRFTAETQRTQRLRGGKLCAPFASSASLR